MFFRPIPLQVMRLTDGAGSKPAYNLRTLCRALDYARTTAPNYGLQRALYDGFSMAFATQVCVYVCVCVMWVCMCVFAGMCEALLSILCACMLVCVLVLLSFCGHMHARACWCVYWFCYLSV
jgi:midasin (ATPase involved in ribosome maturation)